MAVPLDGSVSIRNALPSALAKQRYAPLALHLKRLSTYAISVLVLQSLVFQILDIVKPTLNYNNNHACVKWSHNMTLKAARHIELCKKLVCKWVQDKTIAVKHIAGKINSVDIITNKMRDGTHFCHLWDSFMSRLSNFINTLLPHSHHAHQRSQHYAAPSAAWVTIASVTSSDLSALTADTFCWTVTAVSHQSSAGCQLHHGLHGFIPPDLG
jgi:hypothetical protein